MPAQFRVTKTVPLEGSLRVRITGWGAAFSAFVRDEHGAPAFPHPPHVAFDASCAERMDVHFAFSVEAARELAKALLEAADSAESAPVAREEG